MLGQGDLRLLDVGVPCLLPLGADIAVVALGREQVDDLPAGDFALAHQLQLPAAVLPELGVFHVDVGQARADEIPGILDRFAHAVGVMDVPDRFDVR